MHGMKFDGYQIGEVSKITGLSKDTLFILQNEIRTFCI